MNKEKVTIRFSDVRKILDLPEDAVLKNVETNHDNDTLVFHVSVVGDPAVVKEGMYALGKYIQYEDIEEKIARKIVENLLRKNEK
ncbi:hypothetical protein [Priestia megaterium]|uniref:hypothetical protein n=1 Tax=Priestia megaterium TaxID=1404 RepID=UPI00211C4CC5|nr:hypothetical protein [Priestia megaterium]